MNAINRITNLAITHLITYRAAAIGSQAVRILLLTLLTVASIGRLQSAPAASDKPMTAEQAAVLLESGFSPDDVLSQAKTRGFTGTIDSALSSRLRKAGASAQFVLDLMAITAQESKPLVAQTQSPIAKQLQTPVSFPPFAIRQKVNGTYKFGYMDHTGKICVPLKYDTVHPFNEGRAEVQLGQYWGHVDEKGNEATPLKYQETFPYDHGVAMVKQNNKFGLIDLSAHEILPPRYDTMGSFVEDRAAVQLDSRWGFIDRTGKETVSPRYTGLRNYSSGCARVTENNVVGYVDAQGSLCVKPQYDDGWDFSGDVCAVKKGEKWGLINRQGRVIKAFIYDAAGRASEGLLPVEKNQAWGYIDSFGHEVIPPRFGSVADISFHDGLAAVRESADLTQDPDSTERMVYAKAGYIDKTGKMVIPAKYSNALAFKHGLAPVATSEGWGVVNREGQEVVPLKYDLVQVLDNGLVACYIDDQLSKRKCGYIDPEGTEIISTSYTDARPFSEGMAAVHRGDIPGNFFGTPRGNWGFIDSNGKEVVTPGYDSVDDFIGGVARVERDGRWGAIDRTGKEIVPLKYTWMSRFVNHLALFNVGGTGPQVEFEPEDTRLIRDYDHGGKWGVVNDSGQEIVKPAFDHISYFSGRLTTFFNDAHEHYGLISENGDIRRTPGVYYIGSFQEGLAPASSSLLSLFHPPSDLRTWGFIDANAKFVIKPKFYKAGYFSHGLAPVMLQLKTSSKPLTAEELGEGIAKALFGGGDESHEGEKWGYVNQKGELAIKAKYKYAQPFQDEFARVLGDNGWGMINASGTEIVPLKYEEVGPISEGLIMVKLDDKIGFVDQTGAQVVAPLYDRAQAFSEGLAAVDRKEKTGYVDSQGREIIELKYASGSSFASERAAFQNERLGKYGMIDRSGKEIFPPRYDILDTFCEGRALFENYGPRYWVLLNADGQAITDRHFDSKDSDSGGDPIPILQVVNGVIEGLENGTSLALTPTGQLLWRETNWGHYTKREK